MGRSGASRVRRDSRGKVYWYESNKNAAASTLSPRRRCEMSSNLLVQLGTVGTLILGSAGIWVALLNQRRQLNAQMFIEFSKRFQDLLHLFPTEAWIANLNPSKPLP